MIQETGSIEREAILQGKSLILNLWFKASIEHLAGMLFLPSFCILTSLVPSDFCSNVAFSVRSS